MNNDSKTDNSRPNIDDSTLDRHLGSLLRFEPYPGFEDRVMSRVLAPPPQWVQIMKRRTRSLVETRRVRWLAAGLMTTSTISLVVATTLAFNNYSTVSRVVDWTTTTVGLPIWRAFLDMASQSARHVYAIASPFLVSRDMALVTLGAAVGLLALNTWMLFCLMRPKCMAGSE